MTDEFENGVKCSPVGDDDDETQIRCEVVEFTDSESAEFQEEMAEMDDPETCASMYTLSGTLAHSSDRRDRFAGASLRAAASAMGCPVPEFKGEDPMGRDDDDEGVDSYEIEKRFEGGKDKQRALDMEEREAEFRERYTNGVESYD